MALVVTGDRSGDCDVDTLLSDAFLVTIVGDAMVEAVEYGLIGVEFMIGVRSTCMVTNSDGICDIDNDRLYVNCGDVGVDVPSPCPRPALVVFVRA